ncbi:MAG: mechanosensitive ion channel domain-containing protein [Cyanobacteria bacterium J06641_5]
MSRPIRWLALAFFTALLVMVSDSWPGAIARGQDVATTSSNKAPIVLDGRALFSVGNAGGFSAQERAAKIGMVLQSEVTHPDAPRQLKVVAEAGLIAIRPISDEERSLLTVTAADVLPGTNPRWQAEDWRRSMAAAIATAHEQRQPEYLRRAVLIALAWIAGALVLSTVVAALSQQWQQEVNRLRSQADSPWEPWVEPAGLTLHVGTFVVQVGIWLTVVYAICDRFPLLRQWQYRLWTWLSGPNITFNADRSYSLVQLALLVVLSAGLWLAVSNTTQFLKASVLRHSRMPVATQEVLTFLLRYALVLIGILVLFQLWGIDLRSLALLASVLGVGVGFGVQNIANNFISGLIVALERPIRIGDYVRVGDWTGTVQHIGARHTRISTLDRVTVIVPNSRFLEQEVINWSHGDAVSRLRLPIGVAYGSDVDCVRAALLAAAKAHPEVLLRPRPEVSFQEFGESALKFELLVWTNAPQAQPRLKSELNFRIAACLKRYGITVPFPQRDVNLHAPQLDRALAAWLEKNAPHLAIPPEAPSPPPELPPQPEPAPAAKLPDVEEIVAAMRGPEGVSIRDRHYRLQSYSACFVGLDAVDWLVRTYEFSRPQAVAIGQKMLDRGIIHHVLDEHPFTDSYLFYRFYSDEEDLQ